MKDKPMKKKTATEKRTTRQQVAPVVRQPDGQETDEWSWCEIQKSERFNSAENEKLLERLSRDDLAEIIRGIRREVWLSEVRLIHERTLAINGQDFSGALRANERFHEFGRFKYTVDHLIRNRGQFSKTRSV